MYTVTYSTNRGRNYSDNQFQMVNSLADEMIKASDDFLGGIITEYQNYLTHKQAPIKSYEEYAYELLFLGVLWRTYYSQASKSGKRMQSILNPLNLNKKRELSDYLKKPVENILSKYHFTDETREGYSDSDKSQYNLQNLIELLDELESTGQFKQDLMQLQNWMEFLNFQGPEKVVINLRNICIFADWFKSSSKLVIGDCKSNPKRYFNNVKLIGFEISDRYHK
jgi:hypothetical protein